MRTCPARPTPTLPRLAVVARPLGRQTNNVAEYTALLLALREAQRLGAEAIDLRLDSLLIVEQLYGRWRVKDGEAAACSHAEGARPARRGSGAWAAPP